MRRGLILATVLAATSLIGAAVPVVALQNVTVTVSCHSNPERVTIRNNRANSIVIQKVGSTYQPRSGEPYAVYRTLQPGKSITFSWGSRNGPNKLSGSYIFADHPNEKAKVVTNLGTIKKSC